MSWKACALTLLALLAPQPLRAAQQDAARVLILYDSHPPSNEGKLGLSYAIMLRNLMGHFDLGADIYPIETYTTGEMESYRATFYLGTYYDNPVPRAFFTDLAATSTRVVWFRYNIWQMTQDPSFNFAQRFGFNFTDIRALNAPPSDAQPNPGFFDTIAYKNKSFVKYYSYSLGSAVVNADPEAAITKILDPSKAVERAVLKNSKTAEQTSYVIQSGNFWYVADVPFSYIGPRDRYLVLCDLLHDILGIDHPESHRALIRLEDVSANVDPLAMRKLSDFLFGASIPFSIATIPYYVDPLGYYNDGFPVQTHLKDATNLLAALQYAGTKGATVLMHGYTHQYDATPNLVNGVTADDFEFWNAANNAPVAEDSDTWALSRLDAGLAEFAANGYAPFAWETPHYQGSPAANRSFPKRFGTTYQRVVYYSSETPNLDPLNPSRDYVAPQFFPYIISSDYYGQRIIPENLGNIEYDISYSDPGSTVVYTWNDILQNADYALAVRDGFGSFFFHPFWVEEDFAYLGAMDDFKNLIQGITALGYQWTDASKL